MQNIEAEITLTTNKSDVLGSTQLRQAPGPGAIAVYLASSAADSRAVVIVGGRTLKSDSVIGKVSTNAQIDVLNDSPLVTEVRGGEQVLVDAEVVTPGTIRVKGIWFGEIL